ncbi:lysylphosphatidylglycerol synthase transmembrane domain-containing protein [Sphingomonas limnosediminicola]|uniref:Lysylphosphatidylglycerol synthase transmembrane domain-containing protein n=1 Tax=Sphingomonas limnosediminicola TaxID=940133 RepID=A0ABP7LCR7_9SPHN
MRVRKWDTRGLLKLAIKCVVTAGLLWAAFRSVDVGAVSKLLSGLDPVAAASALALTALIVVSDAMLLEGILRNFERRIPFGTALIYSLVGWFFSNVAPSTVGGDIFRAVQLSRAGTTIATAVRVIVSMRLLSFTSLVAVMLIGFPIAIGRLENHRDVVLLATVLAAALGAVLALACFRPRQWPERWSLVRKFRTLSDDFQRLLAPSLRSGILWLAALAQHGLRVGILACLAAGLGLHIPLATLFALVPAALLIAMVPISFGGWGVREVTFVYLLGAAGNDAESALSLSIAFGVLRLVVGLAGGVTWTLVSTHHYRVDTPT